MGVFIPIMNIRNLMLVTVGITRDLIYHALTMERIDMIWLVICNGVEDKKTNIIPEDTTQLCDWVCPDCPELAYTQFCVQF